MADRTVTAAMHDLEDAIATVDLRQVLGMAAKDAAREEAARDLGADRAFSGFRRKVQLDAGYDLTPNGIRLNLRPAGLWSLASDGRRSNRYVIPRKGRRRRRGHRPAVSTPAGPRYLSRTGTTRGHGTLDRLEARLDGGDVFDDVELALDKAIDRA